MICTGGDGRTDQGIANQIGTGSAADAARYEFETGIRIQGKNHTDRKLTELTTRLENWERRTNNPSTSDLHAAQEMLRDIRNAQVWEIESMNMSADDLLSYFNKIAPAFKDFWNSDENLSIGSDGSFDFYSVCTVFSHYFRNQILFQETTLHEEVWTKNIDDPNLTELFHFIEENIADDDDSASELDNALDFIGN
jgi:hypothetical protein